MRQRAVWQQIGSWLNIIARQEIDEILYEYDIKDGKDYKKQSPEILAVIYENLKIVMEKYDLSEEEANEILADLLGEWEK